MTGQLRIAASQFPVSGDVVRNAKHIHAHIRNAAAAGADIVHFPETALPGYALAHLPCLRDYDWERLEHVTDEIAKAA